jgi:hypothetical protein
MRQPDCSPTSEARIRAAETRAAGKESFMVTRVGCF